MNIYTSEADSQRVVFDEYRFIPLLDQENGCRCRLQVRNLRVFAAGLFSGRVHEDQEVFYVLSGTGYAKVGDRVSSFPGVCFAALPGSTMP